MGVLMSNDTYKLYPKFGIQFADNATDIQREEWSNQTKSYMRRVRELHDKLYGGVGVRVVIIGDLKLIYDTQNHMSLIGNNTNVFPGPYTPLFEENQFYQEVLYHGVVREWLSKTLKNEVKELENKYNQYVANLSKLAAGELAKDTHLSSTE